MSSKAALVVLLALSSSPLFVACGSATSAPPASAAAANAAPVDREAAKRAIAKVLDDWHAAAARADEAAYFAALAPSGVFLGTDATERWNVPAFRAFAHPRFAAGKAWSFRAIRRAIDLSADGTLAWFDEDLATERLGPARGSGVLALLGGEWKIEQYNLASTIPNERFAEVRALLDKPAPPTTTTPTPTPTPTKPSP